MRQPAILGGKPEFPNRIPFGRPTLPPTERILRDVRRILDSRVLTNGRFVERLETFTRERLSARHVIAVSSCTSGLMLVMRALDVQGSVVLPSFTFSATGHAVVWNGCAPVFADIDPMSWNADPESVESSLEKKTAAIVATHVFGAPAPVAELEKIARAARVPLIFDAAHGLGATRDGEPLGGGGTAEVFSMSPTKLATSCEGGLVATDDAALARRVRIGRDYGNPGDYNCEFTGLNARMSEVHAAVGIASLRTLAANARARRRIAARYRVRFGEVPGVEWQLVRPEDRSSYKDVVLAVEPREFGLTRDELARALLAEGIPTRPYFHPPLHRQRAFRRWATPRGALPATDRVASRTIALPVFSHMQMSTVARVARALVRIHENAAEVRENLRSAR